MHPVLFEVFGFPIYSYGAVLSVAFACGVGLTMLLGRRRGHEGSGMADLALWTILAGLAGARLGFVVQNLPWFLEHPLRILNFREGGISIQGGMLLGFTASALWCRRHGISIRDGLDLTAPAALLGMAVGRIGCVLHGCCFGSPAHLPWCITYPASSGIPPVPRHPVQLYEMGMDLVLLALVLQFFARARFAGQTFWVMFGGYGVVRFVSEFYREGALAGPLTPAQWLSLLFLAVGVLGALGVFGRPPVMRGDARP